MAVTRWSRIVGGLLLAAGCATPQAKAKDGDGSEQKGGTVEDDWKAAEAVARRYVTTADGKSPSKVQRDLPRYAFAVRRADGSWKNVLVHKRAVVEARGLPALGEYLKDEQFLATRSVTLPQLLGLLELYDAFPPVAGGAGYLNGGPLQPRLDLDAGGATLVLHYTRAGHSAVDNTPIAPGPGGGPSEPQTTIRATLAIPASYALAWSLSTGPAY
jgi:hypothetical protein